MSEENRKIVIVIGAGASADFYPQNFRFPVGEALIKMIGNEEKITKIFWNEICESFRNVVFEKIKTTNQAMINFHNIFCDFLINQDRSKNNEINIIELNLFQITGNFANYLGKKVSEFKNIINFCYHENNVNRTSVETNLTHMYKNIEENLFDNQKNDKKDYKFYKIIIANCNSRYLQISRLVNYYQPFSIDELLDSIKTEKIDALEPLKIKSEDLKIILKSDEQDQKKLEEQFRNELINAGKTLIALFLLRSEKRELFYNQNPENDSKIWYRHIRNLIINSGKNAEEIKKQIQNLTIISFNYDRSLDYYLRTRLSDYYGEIKERVFYPYGKLAVDNWDLNDYGSFERDGFNPYNEDELEKIRTLGRGLRVIGELDEEVVIQEELDKETKKKLKDFQDFKIDSKSFPGIPAHQILNQDQIRQIDHAFRNNIDTLKEIRRCLSLENKELSDDNPIKKILNHHQIEIDFFIRRVLIICGLMFCNKIYFLGFAFHQSNCDLIALNQLLSVAIKKNIYYTNFYESESINNTVKEIFHIPYDGFIAINPSKRKGVYDALMHDFKLGF